MARVIGRLTALKVSSRAIKPGMYADGGGLYLQVTGTGAKSWIYRYMLRGKEREMGLGSLSAVGLADARTKATECRSLRQAGVDPIEARKSARGPSEARRHEGADVQGRSGRLYRCAPGRLAQPEAYLAVGRDAGYLCQPHYWRSLAAGDRHHLDSQSARADLADQA